MLMQNTAVQISISAWVTGGSGSIVRGGARGRTRTGTPCGEGF
jgi:hypothetical protein